MMLNFLKRIFVRSRAAAPVSAVSAAMPQASFPSGAPVPRVVEKGAGGGVEVASLSLRAILEKLPPDLRAIVNQLPDAAVKIMLPVNTILKQLPTGAVRMSLASLLRQAPQGTFKKTAVEEKQMVDVPLGEIFKSVNPARLARRSDQRRYDVPEDAAGLFGKNGATRSVTAGAPGSGIVPPPAPAATPEATPVPRIAPPKVMRMPGIAPAAPSPAPALGNANGSANGNGHAAHTAPAAVPAAKVPAAKIPVAAPALGGANCELVISFVELAAGWPEGIRSELSLLPGDTKLVIPAPSVSGGLQKGKVSFPWSQVRVWLRPALTGSPDIADDFELIFPLRIMAPAFVAATGATKRREAAEIDHSLPDFFGPAKMPTFKLEPPVPAAAPAPVAEVAAPSFAPTVIETPAAAALVAENPIAPAPAPLKFTVVREEPVPLPEAVAPAEPRAAIEETVAASPAEVVAHVCKLPGVAGAVVALEEGLVIAQSLPVSFSADTFAAFMPQIFGRLEKYTAEMQLGAASEITIETEQGPCHIARRGKLYFGTLGRSGERLPESLANLANQLAAHNS